MNWYIVSHRDLSTTEEMRIAELKDQHWPYGLESQILWMKENTEIDDVHLMGKDSAETDSVLYAYMTLSNIKATIDGKDEEFIGVGGVCVDKNLQGSGVGKQLVEVADRYINGQGKSGILLCKDVLVGFYEKCGWKMMRYGAAYVAQKPYTHLIMFLNEERTCDKIVIDRNF